MKEFGIHLFTKFKAEVFFQYSANSKKEGLIKNIYIDIEIIKAKWALY